MTTFYDQSGNSPPGSTNPVFTGIEKHYRIKHIVELTGLSDRTVRRLLKDEPGVRILPGVAPSRYTRRKYETVLVPASVLQRILTRMEASGVQ